MILNTKLEGGQWPFNTMNMGGVQTICFALPLYFAQDADDARYAYLQ